jgi:hypothetical protein
MAAAAVINVIGAVASVLGIVGFVKTNLPATPDEDHSALRIAVGLTGNLSGGDTPYIAVFNEKKEFIGYWNWVDYIFKPSEAYIDAGGFKDISVTQSCDKCKKGQQATWLQLFQQPEGLDGICIAYLAQTWADGNNRGWLGDMGKLCGRSWYWSDIIVGDASKQYKVCFIALRSSRITR